LNAQQDALAIVDDLDLLQVRNNFSSLDNRLTPGNIFGRVEQLARLGTDRTVCYVCVCVALRVDQAQATEIRATLARDRTAAVEI
jgi:hypothetical protein